MKPALSVNEQCVKKTLPLKSQCLSYLGLQRGLYEDHPIAGFLATMYEAPYHYHFLIQ